MNRSTLVIVGAFSTLLCGTARGQLASQEMVGPMKDEWEFTLSGSGASENDFDTGGFAAGASIGYYLTDNWEAVLRQSVSFSDFGESSWNGSTRVAIDYVFNFDRFRPFLGANFGGLYGDDVKETFAAGLELGVKYYVQPKTFIFGTLEYQWLFDSADRADDAFEDGQFLYGLGIGFNF